MWRTTPSIESIMEAGTVTLRPALLTCHITAIEMGLFSPLTGEIPPRNIQLFLRQIQQIKMLCKLNMVSLRTRCFRHLLLMLKETGS
jgi:hypothetical protein